MSQAECFRDPGSALPCGTSYMMGILRLRVPKLVIMVAYADHLVLETTGRNKLEAEEAGNTTVAIILDG